MTADQTTTTALVARLLALCERFDTNADKTGRTHLDNREGLNHLGVCSLRRKWRGGTRVKDGAGYRMENQELDGTCAEICQEFTAVVAEARAYVAARTPRQLDWVEGVA